MLYNIQQYDDRGCRQMLKDLITYFARLARERFYGTVEVKFEGGRIVFLRVNRTLKPEDLRLPQERLEPPGR